LEELQKEMEDLKMEKEKTTKKKNELLLKEDEKKKKEINEAKIRQIFAQEFRKIKSIIIDELKEMLQKEYENNQSKVNQIKEELNEVGRVLKKCEDEIKQIKEKLNYDE
jgi:uncharacterized protein YukE